MSDPSINARNLVFVKNQVSMHTFYPHKNENYVVLDSVRIQDVQSRLETERPCSIRLIFWTLTFQRRRVALRDQGRLLPNWGPRPHC